MELQSIKFIAIYSLYTILTGFQYGQIRFNLYVEASQKTTKFVIRTFAFTAIACQYMILIYFGISRRWYLPFLLFGLGLIVEKAYAMFEKAVGLHKFASYIYLFSFFGIPICGYLMVVTIPV